LGLAPDRLIIFSLMSSIFLSFSSAQYIPLGKVDYYLLQRIYDKGDLYYSDDFFFKPLKFNSIHIDSLNQDKETSFIRNFLMKRWAFNSTFVFNPDFNIYFANFKNPRNYVRARLDLNLYGRIHNFTFGARTRFDSDGLMDSDYRGKPVNIINGKPYYFSAFHDLGYIGYFSKFFEVLFGKFRIQLGPGESGQMLISSNPPSFDLFLYKIKLGDSLYPKFYVTSFIAQLDNSIYEGKLYYRSLYSQTYNLIFKDFQIGISQSSLLAEENFNLKLNYIFPFISFFGERENNQLNDTDNLLYSFFLSFNRKNFRFYGELLIDDISYDFTLPHKIGFLVGFKLPKLIENLSFSFEYVRINRFTYAYNLGSGAEIEKNEIMLRYVFYGRKNDFQNVSIIGHWLGPDTDLIQMGLWKYIDKGIFTVLNVSFKRKGEGNILEPTQKSSPKPKAFLYGVVEKTISINTRFVYLMSHYFYLSLDLFISKIYNLDNVENQNRFKINLMLSLKFDPFVTIM